MTMAPRAKFIGTGMFVPDRVVTNDDLTKLMDTSDEWIRQRSGVVERR
jgi:3-oxoacyl-[acyl-carrier-protein] synthase-3